MNPPLRQYLEDFSTLFSGNKDSYGVHIPEPNPTKGEKAKGKSFFKHEKLTDELYLKHLHGEISIGVVPINKNGLVSFAAIDVDVYPLDPIKYLMIVQRAKLPFVGFSSKSKGMHLCCFFDPPAKASDVLPLLEQTRDLLALDPATELFPKQINLTPDSSGSFLNLPYFNANDTVRHAYSSDGQPLPLSTALNICKQVRTTPKILKTALNKVAMAEAPPCLQTLFLQGGASDGERNEYLRSCGVYLKARFGEDFAENLHLLNNNTLDPLDYIELDTTVISSLNKKDYNYACRSPLLKQYCNRTECASRKYGIGGEYISDFEFGQLTRFKGDDEDEYYTWIVNGEVFYLYGINDLIKQDRFRALSGSKLNKIPNRLKEPVWLNIVNKALSNVQIDQDEISMGLSERAQWRAKVEEFFATRKALRVEQLLEGMVYLKEGKLFFKTTVLQEFLTASGVISNITRQKQMKMLKDYGVKRGSVRIGKKVHSFNYVVLREQHSKDRLLSVQPFKERVIQEEIKKAKKDKEEEYNAEVLDFTEKDKF